MPRCRYRYRCFYCVFRRCYLVTSYQWSRHSQKFEIKRVFIKNSRAKLVSVLARIFLGKKFIITFCSEPHGCGANWRRRVQRRVTACTWKGSIFHLFSTKTFLYHYWDRYRSFHIFQVCSVRWLEVRTFESWLKVMSLPTSGCTWTSRRSLVVCTCWDLEYSY